MLHSLAPKVWNECWEMLTCANVLEPTMVHQVHLQDGRARGLLAEWLELRRSAISFCNELHGTTVSHVSHRVEKSVWNAFLKNNFDIHLDDVTLMFVMLFRWLQTVCAQHQQHECGKVYTFRAVPFIGQRCIAHFAAQWQLSVCAWHVVVGRLCSCAQITAHVCACASVCLCGCVARLLPALQPVFWPACLSVCLPVCILTCPVAAAHVRMRQ